MKRNPKEKFVVLYDTAKKSLLILDQLFVDFQYSTNQLSEDNSLACEPIVTKIYISALGLIDYFHRFHEIISAFNLIRKDRAELKALARTIKPVTTCRNYLQHMRGDLVKNEAITYPVLGAISWIHENRNFTLYSNQPTPEFSCPGIVYDTVEKKYLCKYLLMVGGCEIQLDTVYNEIKSFWKWLEKSIVIEPSHLKSYEWGKPTLIYTEFKKV